MSWLTRSGKPFLSTTYRKDYHDQCREFLKQIDHLKECPHFAKLYKPSVENYIKGDIINPTHGIMCEKKLMTNHLRYMSEKHSELRGKHESDVISDIEWRFFNLEYTINKLTYVWLFGNDEKGIFPMNHEISKELLSFKKIKLAIKDEIQHQQKTESSKENDEVNSRELIEGSDSCF